MQNEREGKIDEYRFMNWVEERCTVLKQSRMAPSDGL